MDFDVIARLRAVSHMEDGMSEEKPDPLAVLAAAQGNRPGSTQRKPSIRALTDQWVAAR